METEFEQRLCEVLTEYPGLNPEKAALALRGQPQATNEQIARLSRLSQEEANQVARGNLVSTEKEQTGTPPDLAQALETPSLRSGRTYGLRDPTRCRSKPKKRGRP